MANYCKLLISIFFGCLIATPVIAEPNYDLGKQKAALCAACHNEDGNSNNPIYPKIAGQNQRYFIEQMLDFKQGAASGRDNAVMHGIAINLSNDDIAALAAYFSAQTMSQGATNPKYVKLGQQMYRGGIITKNIPACSSCHDPQGRGNIEAGFPWLAGQFSEYTITQLKAYRNGQRKNDVNKIMQTVAGKLNDQEIVAVAEYVEGLH